MPPALCRVPKMPLDYRVHTRNVCQRQIMPTLMGLVEGQLSQDDIVKAVLDPELWSAYSNLHRFIGADHFAKNRLHLEGAEFVTDLPYQLLDATTILPTCPDPVRRKIVSHAKDRVAVAHEAGNVYAVFETLDELCENANQMRLLFPQVEVLMEHDEGLKPALERLGAYKRPKYMPLVSPALRGAVDAAKPTIAKWLLVKEVDRPQPRRSIMRLCETPAKHESWGTIHGFSE